jgi:hypothetical protein
MSTQHTIKRSNSEALFETAKTYFPGGVNSPVRAFKSVEGSPLLLKKEMAVTFGMKTTISLSIIVAVGDHLF